MVEIGKILMFRTCNNSRTFMTALYIDHVAPNPINYVSITLEKH